MAVELFPEVLEIDAEVNARQAAEGGRDLKIAGASSMADTE